MISIVTKFTGNGQMEVIQPGAHEVTDIDTAGSHSVFKDATRSDDDKVAIRIWCRNGADPNGFFIAIHQDHFLQILDCIVYADVYGYTDMFKEIWDRVKVKTIDNEIKP